MKTIFPQIVVSIYNDTWAFKLDYPIPGKENRISESETCRARGEAKMMRFPLHSTAGKSGTSRTPWIEVPKNASNCRCKWEQREVGEEGTFQIVSTLRNCTLVESNLLDDAQVDLSLKEDSGGDSKGEGRTRDEDLVFVVVKGDVVCLTKDVVLLRSCNEAGEEKLHYLKSNSFVLSGTVPVYKKLLLHLSKEERDFLETSNEGDERAGRLKVFFDLPFKYNANPTFAPLVGANAGRKWLDVSGTPCEQQLADEGEGQWPSPTSLSLRGPPVAGESSDKSWKVERTILVRRAKEGKGSGSGDPRVECRIEESVVLLPNANLNVELAELDRSSTRMKLMKGHNLPPEQRKPRSRKTNESYYYSKSSAPTMSFAKAFAPAAQEEASTSAPSTEGISESSETGGEEGAFAKSAKNSYGTTLYGPKVLLSSQQPLRYRLAESEISAVDFYGVWIALSYSSEDVEGERWTKPRPCRTLLFKGGKGLGWSYRGRTTMYDELDNVLPVAVRTDQLDEGGRVVVGAERRNERGEVFLTEGSPYVFVSPPDGTALIGKPSGQSQSWEKGEDSDVRLKVAKVAYDVVLSHASASLRKGAGGIGVPGSSLPPAASWDGKNDAEDSSDSSYVAVFFVFDAQKVKLFQLPKREEISIERETTEGAPSGKSVEFERFSKYASSARFNALEGGSSKGRSRRVEKEGERRPSEEKRETSSDNEDRDLDDAFDRRYPELAGYRAEMLEYLESVAADFGCVFPREGEKFDNLVLCCVTVDKLTKGFRYRLEAENVSAQRIRTPKVKVEI